MNSSPVPTRCRNGTVPPAMAGLRLRPLALLLWLLWLAAGAPPVSAAELRIGDGSGAPGMTVFIPVSLSAGAGQAVAAQFEIIYDSTRLRADGAVLGPQAPGLSLGSHELKPGTRRVLAYSSKSEPSPDGVLLSIPFNILSGATSGPVTLSLTNALLSDKQGQRVASVKLVPGQLTISATPATRFTSVLFDTTRQLRFELSAADGKSCVLQISPDLKLWQPLSTNVAVNGVIRAIDPSPARDAARFYRALQLP